MGTAMPATALPACPPQQRSTRTLPTTGTTWDWLKSVERAQLDGHLTATWEKVLRKLTSFRGQDAAPPAESPTPEPEVLAAAGAAEFAVVWADDAEAEPG